MFTYLLAKVYKSKHLQWLFADTTDAAVKGKIYKRSGQDLDEDRPVAETQLVDRT